MTYKTASDLTKMMLEYLKEKGNVVWRNNNLAVKGRGFIGKKGVGDIIGYSKKYGQFISLEIKTIADRMSADQFSFLTELGANNGLALLVHQVRDGDIIMTIFKDYEEKKFKFDVSKNEFYESN
jgi:hypothetical protein